jgi:hypothetical protein
MESMKQGGRHSHSGGDDEKHRAMSGMDHSAMPGMPLIPASDIHKH